jgi:hypothetical protein
MARVLVCVADPAADGLDRTILWRQDIERTVIPHLGGLLALVLERRPQLLFIDRDQPDLEGAIRQLRAEASTRTVSVAVGARGDLRPIELQLLDAGANAIIRLPATPECNERLSRLIAVPLRKAVRIPVRLQVEGQSLLDVRHVSGTIVNISVSGMLVESTQPLEMFSEITFVLQLPGTALPTAGHGRVVRHAGGTEYGVEFDGIDPATIERIAQLRG